MLSQIHVRDFAIIDEVTVEFDAGMNVLTGETGAGKSILIDALTLALGARAAADVIRAGQTRAEITVTFSISADSKAADWLAEQTFDHDDECFVRRVIARDGRSRGFINGNPVPMQSLRELGALLVNIHGQHEHQNLQQSDAQRRMLDARGALSKQLTDMAKAYAAWQALEQERATLQTAREQRDERLAFVSFQLDELEALEPDAAELRSLGPEQARLANSERLAGGSHDAIAALADDGPGNALSLVARASRALQSIAAFDESLTPVIKMIDEAEVNISEAAESLRRYMADIEIDPGRQEVVEARLADYERLARKHQMDADALSDKLTELAQERDTLQNADAALDALAANCEAAREHATKVAAKLSRARRKAAKSFAIEVTDGMQTLGMPGGQFEVSVAESNRLTVHGSDNVLFNVSANPGQPLQPVHKVASGGELSRISLAIQVAAGRRDLIASMVFDEVDTGVGGAVAEMVGQQMRQLAEDCQVLAVTHLPQVAGQAHHHHKVAKLTDGKTTRTTIQSLDQAARVEEIARMLGGVSITDASRKHAQEMLRSAG